MTVSRPLSSRQRAAHSLHFRGGFFFCPFLLDLFTFLFVCLFHFTVFNGKIKQRIDQIVAGTIRLLRKPVKLFHQFLPDPYGKHLVTILALHAFFCNNELIFHKNHLIIIFPCFIVKIYVIIINITYVNKEIAMICTFFGHRDTPPEIQASLREVILHLIETQGVHQFFVGNQGSFDAMACSLLSGFEQTHGIKFPALPSEDPRRRTKSAPRPCSGSFCPRSFS